MKIHLFILFIFITNGLLAQQTIYVSLDGDDHWSGKLPDANASNNNGPFKTFERALREIETLRSNRSFKDSVIIQVRQGTYPLKKSLRMSEQHSGKPGHPITWKNYNNEKVQLIGGQRVGAMEPVTDSSLL